jgi:hypothetical protein
MAARDTIAVLAEELGAALRPLAEAFASDDVFPGFMWDLGWDFETMPPAFAVLRAPSQTISDVLDQGEIDVGSAVALLDALRVLLRAIDDFGTIPDAVLPPTIDPVLFKAEFPRQLVDTLIVDALFARQYKWATLLQAAGVIQVEEQPEAGLRPAYRKRSIAFEDLGRLLDDSLALFKGTYHWGAADFRAEAFVSNIADFAAAWGLSLNKVVLDDELVAFFRADAVPGEIRDVHDLALRLPLMGDVGSSTELDAGIQLAMLPETAASRPGFAIVPYGHGSVSIRAPLTAVMTAFLEGDADFSAGVGVLVRPDEPVRLLKDIIPSTTSGTTPPSGARLGFGVEVKPESGGSFIVIGSSEGSRLEVSSMSVRAGMEARTQGTNDLFLEFELTKSALTLDVAGSADGFLGTVLPATPLKATFTLGVGVSVSQGVYFTGSSALEVQIPAHLQLGPLEIVSALVAIKPAGRDVPVDLAATIKADFGVLEATVENIGLTATFTTPPDRKGRFGPVDVSLGFRAPNGVALVVDAGIVEGGGYLFFDADKGEYAGAMELTIGDFLSLKAIGLINTRLPGGEPGFSLLVIITAEFNPGFQLGFGFVLAGVGGLLGLNRAVLLDPLALAVRTGTAQNLLFPTNVVENAPRILSDLRVIFPPQRGRFLIGPMAKIGWGTPTLISISLGVIIEIPGNIVILGRLRVNLPTEDRALILLQVTFVGAIEFDKRRIWFFAALFESRVLFITIDGEMGLLMDFSDNPNFVLTVGGFHPRFQAPALPFPTPRRIALSLINESYARIRVEGYFAVTTNSVQFGARAEMFFGFSALSVQGHLTFDALFRFSPLSFIVEISAGFSVKVFGLGVYGVRLRGTLEGPAPWRVRGSASISFFFFDIDVDVDVTFGDRITDTLAAIAIMPLVQAEIEKPENWVARLPPSSQLLVSLRDLKGAGDLVLHPVGTLRISQRAVPLGVTLDKVGNQKGADVNLVSVEPGAGPLTLQSSAREPFARAQFQEMDDGQKLSQPAFEPLQSGVELASRSPWVAGPGAERNVRYETIIIDTAFRRFRIPFFRFWASLFEHFRAGSAISRSPLSLAFERRTRPFVEKVQVAGDRFAVAFAKDNRVYTGASIFVSYAEAEQHLNEAVRANPALADTIHVVPAAELNLAA